MSSERILWEIQDHYLDEAEFLFEQWSRALDAPNYTLDDLISGPEKRLLANVEAMAVGGQVVADELLWPALGKRSTGRARAVVIALTLLTIDWLAGCDRLLELAAADEAQGPAVARALGLNPKPELHRHLLRRLPGLRGPALGAALTALATHRKPIGAAVTTYLDSGDPALVAPALLVLGPEPGPDLLAFLTPLAKSPEIEIRRAAIEIALVYNLAHVEEVVSWWAFTDDSSLRAQAYTWLALIGREPGLRRLIDAVEDPAWAGEALWALGYCGRVEAVTAALELLDDPTLGPLAAELMVGITGLPTADDSLWTKPAIFAAEARTPPLVADDLDADLVPGPMAMLPTPRPAAIKDWWRGQRENFEVGVRYQYGAPMDRGSLLRTLRGCNMRRRHLHGLELAVRSRGCDFISTRCFGRVQKSRTPT